MVLLFVVVFVFPVVAFDVLSINLHHVNDMTKILVPLCHRIDLELLVDRDLLRLLAGLVPSELTGEALCL